MSDDAGAPIVANGNRGDARFLIVSEPAAGHHAEEFATLLSDRWRQASARAVVGGRAREQARWGEWSERRV